MWFLGTWTIIVGKVNIQFVISDKTTLHYRCRSGLTIHSGHKYQAWLIEVE